MPELSDKKYPKLDVRLPPELDRQIRAEALLDGVPPTTCARVLWEEALRARALRRAGGAVEQALGNRGGPPAGAVEPSGDEALHLSGRAPAPAEPPQEEYVPEWKQRTAPQPRSYGPIPKK